ncbi:MAG: NUDIX domain-containing protein [Minisyncoccia bacterium]|jgi:8-oxo-dGTP diphosphatase
MAPKLFVATKALIVNNEGKVLLIRESSQYKDGSKIGGLDTPGGRVQAGQHFDESLKREVREETGLEIRIGESFFVNESWPMVRGESWQIIRIFFECYPESSDVRLSDDHDAFEWIDPEEYARYPIIENLKPMFEVYLKKNDEAPK